MTMPLKDANYPIKDTVKKSNSSSSWYF
uniref:Uncharacterized protein n=1 Tax=Arundo donax TaxID=35708 RepID=A0A0A9AZC8_ARUDO